MGEFIKTINNNGVTTKKNVDGVIVYKDLGIM